MVAPFSPFQSTHAERRRCLRRLARCLRCFHSPTIAVPVQTSAQGKPQLLGATSRHFQNRKKKRANMLVCFSLFQHAVSFFGGVYLCPNTPCLPVCGANG